MILQGVEFHIFLLIFAWALQQCIAKALPVMAVSSDEDDAAAVFVMLHLIRKQHKKRNIWVRPCIMQRYVFSLYSGIFHYLMQCSTGLTVTISNTTIQLVCPISLQLTI